MKFILFTNITFNYRTVAFMEIRQNFKQLLIWLIYSAYQIWKLIFLEIFIKSSETVLHEFVNFNRIMIFMCSMNGETNRANQSSIFTIAINANKSGILSMWVAVVWFYEILKTFRKLLNFYLYTGHLQLCPYNKIILINKFHFLTWK